jgi:SAM-dependent methyltransferase
MAEFDSRAESYERESRWSVSERVAVECARLFEDADLGRLLDAGGGTGSLSGFLGKVRDVLEVVVLDESPAMLAKVPAGCTKWQGRLEDLRAEHPDEFFDTILLRQVLHYLDDPVSVIRKLNAHLRPGGTLYVGQLIAPSALSAEWLVNVARYLSPRRRRVYTCESLVHTMLLGGDAMLRASLTPQAASLREWMRSATATLNVAAVMKSAVESLESQVAEDLLLNFSDSDLKYDLMWFHGIFRDVEDG